MSEGRVSTTPPISSCGLILAFRLVLFSLSQAPDLSQATQSSELHTGANSVVHDTQPCCRLATLDSESGAKAGARAVWIPFLEYQPLCWSLPAVTCTRVHVAPPLSLSCLRPHRM
ncbi:hypothetical protein B0H13DRAFT_2040072 [Mycena leptocephala]|nr:hypothetical protein B0H13DRAFT_2040072 [Mycena leptocephala]